MGTSTPNYGLYKPDPDPTTGDFVNVVTDINNNMDTLDTQLKGVADSVRTVLMVRKTADKSITSDTALQADNHLFLPLAANSVYFMDCFFMYNGLAAAGIKFDWTGPAGFSTDWAGYGVNFGGPLNDYDVVEQSLAGGRAYGGNGAVDMTMQPKGIVGTAGTAGTLTLRWAQQVLSATPTILRTNSIVRLMKL
jgi:hypothetical protein